MHNATADVSQTEVAATVAPSELFMVKAKEVQQGRVQVVDMDSILDGVEPYWSVLPKWKPGFNPPPASHQVKPWGL